MRTGSGVPRRRRATPTRTRRIAKQCISQPDRGRRADCADEDAPPQRAAADAPSDDSRARRRPGPGFDRVAREYDRSRPQYPPELVAHACAVARLGAGERVLEIGCGSGQLTCELLARGLRVTAVEPGANLIALGTKRCRGAGEVDFVPVCFEDALGLGGTLALLQYCGLVAASDDQATPPAWPPQRELDPIRAGVEARRANVSEVWSWIGGYHLARADVAELFTG